MPQTVELRTKSRLSSLQAGRAVAALLLVCYHDAYCAFAPKYWSSNPVRNLYAVGFASFYYFFVLSGFTIMLNHATDLGRPAKLRSFVWQRFARIYPAYWVVLSLLVITYFLFPQFGEGFEREAKMIVSSFSLTTYGLMRDAQRPETIMLGVWALYHGILFYTFFGLVILNIRIGLALMVLWLSASVLMLFILPDPGLMSFYFAPIHLLVGMGMGAAVLFRKSTISFPRALALLGVILLLAAAFDQLWFRVLASIPRSLLYGAGSACAMLGFAVLERNGRLRVPVTLKFLGDASYSIFLVHYPVLILLTKLTSRLRWREALPLTVWYVIFAITAVCVSILFYLFVERPILRQLACAKGRLTSNRNLGG